MISPVRTEFEALAAGHDVVPVFEEILVDSDTPLSVFRRFADRENAFLFESMEGGEKWGRYSFVGVDPELFLRVEHGAGPSGGLEKLRDIYRGVRLAEIPGLPRFCGGAVGFVGYEAGGEFERLPHPKPDCGAVDPCSRFLKADKLIVFDNVRHTAKVVVCSRPAEFASAGEAYDDAAGQIRRIVAQLRAPAAHEDAPPREPVKLESNLSAAEFEEMVRRAKRYIVAGDIIQVVLSQRFSAPSAGLSPLALYRALRFLNPSPYTFFLKVGDRVLIGSSPELMVRVTGNRVEVRPIAGTRPRGATEQEDRRLADELLADEKEKAEHVMLVDLGRNDVGRVSEPGSVQVTEYMVVERYSHVMHIVSHVQGVLRRELDAFDALRSTFPAGTLSGAPKIRAMQIIHELEPGPRGAYGGAVGTIGYDGNMDMAITIRTMDLHAGRVAVQAGAGIVYDSDPRTEFLETCHKARAVERALEMACRGLEIG
jgi:anthranilate synthase component 1